MSIGKMVRYFIHFIETRLQCNWRNNKNADGLVNMLTSNLVILNQAHRVAWLIGPCYPTLATLIMVPSTDNP